MSSVGLRENTTMTDKNIKHPGPMTRSRTTEEQQHDLSNLLAELIANMDNQEKKMDGITAKIVNQEKKMANQ